MKNAWSALAKGCCFLIGVGGFLLFSVGFLIRLSVWSARHCPGTRASMVTTQEHILGFAITLVPCLFFAALAVAPFCRGRKGPPSQ